MNTKKINCGEKPLMIAHRGASGLEIENTVAAFVAAGNRSYFGIETDTHVTADGKFIIYHDNTTGRLSDIDLTVDLTDYDILRSVKLNDTHGTDVRHDMHPANVDEYLSICRKYEKKAVLELKNAMPKEKVSELCDMIERSGWLDETIFISFHMENLIFVREKLPSQKIQFLCEKADDVLLEELSAHKMDIDIRHTFVTNDFVEKCHSRGIRVNCWTVDDPADAEALARCGVDFITSNILE